MIFGLEKILNTQLTVDSMESILNDLINAINFLKNESFSSLLIFLYFELDKGEKFFKFQKIFNFILFLPKKIIYLQFTYKIFTNLI